GLVVSQAGRWAEAPVPFVERTAVDPPLLGDVALPVGNSNPAFVWPIVGGEADGEAIGGVGMELSMRSPPVGNSFPGDGLSQQCGGNLLGKMETVDHLSGGLLAVPAALPGNGLRIEGAPYHGGIEHEEKNEEQER